MSNLDLYCDHNATRPMNGYVRKVFFDAVDNYWANSYSPHSLGREASNAVDRARNHLAAMVGCSPRAIRFTSGATESNAWVMSAVRSLGKPNVLVSSIEHPSVLQWGTQFAKVDANGLVCLHQLEEEILRLGSSLGVVSVMAANNETGVIQPIEDIYQICRRHNVLFHCDATQVFDRISIVLQADFITLSGHKFGGPKGIGALCVATEIPPLLLGGPQERETRAGTHNVPAIVGMGAAAERVTAMSSAKRDKLEQACKRLGGVILGDGVERLPNTSSVLFPYPGDLVVMALDLRGVQASTGSACSSGAAKQSHVLEAMSKQGTPVRFSIARETDIESVIKCLEDVIRNLEGVCEL